MVEPMARPVDQERPWYHGSPHELTTLRAGSTVTQNKELARIFSHKPALVVGEETNRRWKHTGPFEQGFLYRLIGPVALDDVGPVPDSRLSPGLEWNTRCEFALELDTVTAVDPAELITQSELLQLVADGLVQRQTADTIIEKQRLPA
jgi:hypothetical protein